MGFLFCGLVNHQNRHSGIKYVTSHQRHCGEEIAICKKELIFMIRTVNLIPAAGQQP